MGPLQVQDECINSSLAVLSLNLENQKIQRLTCPSHLSNYSLNYLETGVFISACNLRILLTSLSNERDDSPSFSFKTLFCTICRDEIETVLSVLSVPTASSLQTLVSLSRAVVSVVSVVVVVVVSVVVVVGVVLVVLILAVVAVVFVVVVGAVALGSLVELMLLDAGEDKRSVDDVEVESDEREKEVDGLEEMTEHDMLFESIFPLVTGLSHA